MRIEVFFLGLQKKDPMATDKSNLRLNTREKEAGEVRKRELQCRRWVLIER